jgi:hypothetical protein
LYLLILYKTIYYEKKKIIDHTNNLLNNYNEKKNIEKNDNDIIQKFDFDLKKIIKKNILFKLSKNCSYFLGNCSNDIEKQFLQNYILIYKNNNIQYDDKECKIFIKNIDYLLNTKIFFAKSFIKIGPGIYKFRDNFSINIRIYFKFEKNQEKYIFKNYLKLFK